MSTITDLRVEARTPARKGPSKRLRVAGKLPVILYGHGDAKPLSISEHELNVSLKKSPDGMRTIFKLNGAVSGDTVIIKAWDRDPVTERFVHIDLFRINLDEEIELSIPVHLTGQSVGVRAGGFMNHVMHHVHIMALPLKAPRSIDVDVSKLEINQSIHVSDLPKLEGVRYLPDPKDAVAVCQPPKAEVEATPAAAGEEPKEPELVKAKKAEEEPAEDEKGGAKKDEKKK